MGEEGEKGVVEKGNHRKIFNLDRRGGGEEDEERERGKEESICWHCSGDLASQFRLYIHTHTSRGRGEKG